MTCLTHLLLGSLAVLSTNAAAVLDLIPSNFDSVVLSSGKPALVEFFAPWCGHCKTLAPVYEELAKGYEWAEDKLVIGKVDADEHKELGKKFGVQGFPTLKWFDGKGGKPEDYNSGRDLESLTEFIKGKTGLKPRVKKSLPSAVEMLDDKTFKTEIGGDKSVLVAVTAPWCGHCKKLAPVWETLALDFALEPNVLVAKIDAEAPDAKATAQDLGVTSYPTIKYFPAGSSTPVDYTGGRSEADLVAYLNEQAGTHRAVGGGLDAKAGTVAALDALVEKFNAGQAIDTITKEVTKAAQGAKDKYAEYYVKVFAKLAKSEGYAQKELSRLDGILKRGGLAPEKKDDVTIRRNILSLFGAKTGGKEEL